MAFPSRLPHVYISLFTRTDQASGAELSTSVMGGEEGNAERDRVDFASVLDSVEPRPRLVKPLKRLISWPGFAAETQVVSRKHLMAATYWLALADTH